MSIENNIERIANALEELVKNQNSAAAVVSTVDTPQVEAPAPTPAPVPNTPTVPAPPAPAPVEQAAPDAGAVPSAPAPVVETQGMTPEELNDALVAEFNRLGERREFIDEAFKKFNATSVSDLDPAHYADVVAAVKAVTL